MLCILEFPVSGTPASHIDSLDSHHDSAEPQMLCRYNRSNANIPTERACGNPSMHRSNVSPANPDARLWSALAMHLLIQDHTYGSSTWLAASLPVPSTSISLRWQGGPIGVALGIGIPGIYFRHSLYRRRSLSSSYSKASDRRAVS